MLLILQLSVEFSPSYFHISPVVGHTSSWSRYRDLLDNLLAVYIEISTHTIASHSKTNAC